MEPTKLIEICRIIFTDNKNVAARISEKFAVTRQSASSWLGQLKNDGAIKSIGIGRGTQYFLEDTTLQSAVYKREGLSEDIVWRQQCAPVVADLPDNVKGIWHYGITEMVNNAIDHSGSDDVTVTIRRNSLFTECEVSDKGEGIFLKIQRALNLYDARESILELAKGKFTTDPANHSGEGIFFSSKMFDDFIIRSGVLSFFHSKNNAVLLTQESNEEGTQITMRLDNDSPRIMREIFDKFAVPDEYSFAKTIVPVRLAQHEGETLVSRSQAKRLTRRFERFETVILDFSGVEEIGQAFADEVFRVFATAHPKIDMTPINMSGPVNAMVKRAQNPT
jgi:anti-sigma regulatory factor (Ser/Thr protein kinase)